MSDSCTIVCNTNNDNDCGCNIDGGKTCTGYCTCTGNRSRRLTSATYSPYVAYCRIVNSYKYDTTKNITNSVVCSNHNPGDKAICSGVRNKATITKEGTYTRISGGKVYNELSSGSDDRYHKYTTEDVDNTTVESADLNYILGILSAELNQRQAHTWYNGMDIESFDNVDNTLLVDNSQQNTPINILSKIKNIIKEKNDYDNSSTIKTRSRSVLEGDLIEASNLKNIEQDLFNINIDCICYADCTEFLVKSRRSCTCNIDCKCNYS